jgi:hypothetical protein
VQFVPFNAMNGDGNRLASELLAEVPAQVVSYFKLKKIAPHPLPPPMPAQQFLPPPPPQQQQQQQQGFGVYPGPMPPAAMPLYPPSLPRQ